MPWLATPRLVYCSLWQSSGRASVDQRTLPSTWPMIDMWLRQFSAIGISKAAPGWAVIFDEKQYIRPRSVSMSWYCDFEKWALSQHARLTRAKFHPRFGSRKTAESSYTTLRNWRQMPGVESGSDPADNPCHMSYTLNAQ